MCACKGEVCVLGGGKVKQMMTLALEYLNVWNECLIEQCDTLQHYNEKYCKSKPIEIEEHNVKLGMWLSGNTLTCLACMRLGFDLSKKRLMWTKKRHDSLLWSLETDNSNWFEIPIWCENYSEKQEHMQNSDWWLDKRAEFHKNRTHTWMEVQ